MPKSRNETAGRQRTFSSCVRRYSAKASTNSLRRPGATSGGTVTSRLVAMETSSTKYVTSEASSMGSLMKENTSTAEPRWRAAPG
jgi:hypothetical protein